MDSSGVDTSPDQMHSDEMQSPDHVSVIPRKLRFGSPQNSEMEKNNRMHDNLIISPKKVSVSPPYRKVRALRLFDSPATPKTIIQKSSGKCLKNHLSQLTPEDMDMVSKPVVEPPVTTERPRALPLHNRTLNNTMQCTANVNPFTPEGLMSHNKKRCRTQFGRENAHQRASLPFGLKPAYDPRKDDADDDDVGEVVQAPKRLALQDTNISRYKKEFLEISLIGVGEFGLVYQCMNRLDGCIYAIKKSIKPVAGSSFEKRALNEVWAHAVLGKHDNVVRYYSAWAEDNHMLIQNEFCNGGSLQSLIQKRFLKETELRILLLHIAEGLKYIHSNNLVHMDLKAGNIFLTKVPARTSSVSSDDGFEDLDAIYEELENTEAIITYKIGDLGHVTSCKDAHVEEGDCRYLPNEILQEDFRHLFKADIFSLGITLYEAAGGGPLPKNGPEWHKLRNGQVPEIPTLSREFNDLIRLMTHPDPNKRPTSTSIFNHPVLCSLESKSKSQLSQELAIERRKNDILMRKLAEAKAIIKSYEQSSRTPNLRSKSKLRSPIITERCLRSYTRKRQKTYSGSMNDGLRDRNKNVISNIQY